MKKPRVFAGLAVLVVSTIALTACGGAAVKTSSGASDTTGPKVGIFVDDSFGDHDFLDQGGAAKPLLEKNLGATVKTYEGHLNGADFPRILTDAGQANSIVFVLGFEATDAMATAAKANPNTTYVFIDGNAGNPNVISAVFATAEACFMAGALSAEFEGTHSTGSTSQAVGFIGGVNSPVVNNCQAGFTQGANKVSPQVKVLAQDVGSFTDPSKAKEIALTQQQQGAGVLFAYAGLSGAGAFDAAKNSSNPLYAVGVVADKSYLAPGKTPGSLLMNVDKVILNVTNDLLAKKIAKGAVQTFGFSNGGWTMQYDPKLVDQKIQSELNGIQKQIETGAIKVGN